MGSWGTTQAGASPTRQPQASSGRAVQSFVLASSSSSLTPTSTYQPGLFFFTLFHFLSLCKRPGYQRPNGRRRKLRVCEEKLTFRHLARALGSRLLVLGAVPREGPIPGAPSNRSRSRNRSRNRSRSRNTNRNRSSRSSSRLPAPSGGALGAHQRLTRRILSASHSPCGF